MQYWQIPPPQSRKGTTLASKSPLQRESITIQLPNACLRAAVNRASASEGLKISTSSGEDYFYIWRGGFKSGCSSTI
jgi:hypothetical protein